MDEFYRILKKLGAKETDDDFFETDRNNGVFLTYLSNYTFL